MKISSEPYGKLPDGSDVTLFILENNSGIRAEIADFGGALVRLLIPDRQGVCADIVLGHPALEGYLTNAPHFGVLIGRNSNRIEGARLYIAGTEYRLTANADGNNLHSGPNSLSFRLLRGEARTETDRVSVQLSGVIEHMGDGFPGNLSLKITYTLTGEDELQIHYEAVSDRDTVINLTNHSYFNLAGHDSGPVYDQQLEIHADLYTPLGNTLCPTGEIHSVGGTALDFRQAKPIGRDIQQTCGGFDNNFVLPGTGFRPIATASDPASGRVMEVCTDLPAVQLYTAGSVNGVPGKEGAVYQQHSGFCLETQFVPNAMNMPWLASPIFRAGEMFRSTTTHCFGII